MKGSRIHLELLKVFKDLAEEKNFARVAKRNHLSPGAITQQIAFLERRFGKKLVERGKKESVLTEEGKIFLEACCEISRIYEDGVEKIRYPGELSGVVRVATIYSIGLYSLSGYIRSFLRSHNRIDLRVEYEGADKVYSGVQEGVYDLGIVAYPYHHPSIDIIPFKEEALTVVCSPDDSLAKMRGVRLRDLRGKSFVAFGTGIPTRRAIDILLHKQGIRIDIKYECDNIETLKRLVEINAGISILPENTVISEVKNKTLSRIPLLGGSFVRPLGVICKRGRILPRGAQEFIRWLAR